MAIQMIFFAFYPLNTCKPSKILQAFCPTIQWFNLGQVASCKALFFWASKKADFQIMSDAVSLLAESTAGGFPINIRAVVVLIVFVVLVLAVMGCVLPIRVVL
jgi:hypothetical protein